MAFCHLHNHSDYSLLDGMTKPKNLVSRAKELGMDAIALTDHGVLYGLVPFYLSAQEQGIHPILGAELYLTSGSRFEKNKDVPKAFHVVLLAMNNKGYKNLMRLSTLSYQEGFYRKPRVDLELLQQYNEGLICLTACFQGLVPNLLLQGAEETAYTVAESFATIFKERFYIELQAHGIREEIEVAPQMISLANKLGIPMVATNDIHYLDHKESRAKDALYCVREGKTLAESDQKDYFTDQLFFKTEVEMRSLGFPAEAYDNTNVIAEQCNVELEFKNHWAKWDMGESKDTVDDRLKEHIENERWYKDIYADKEDAKRLKYELDVITSKKLSDYFLIVADIVEFAKTNGIPMGDGRGSAAGSLVSYVLDITNINPLKYGLMFERFLNPDRDKMPDIDLDFGDQRRDEVIEYITNKYGEDKVARIGTFGRMEAKVAIKDAARVLGHKASFGQKLANEIEYGTNLKKVKLDKYSGDEKEILELASGFQGILRQEGQHAAGIVISDTPLTDIVALKYTSQGPGKPMIDPTIQADMGTAEKLGLLKVDILGLKTVTTIKNVMQAIDMDSTSEIPENDLKTYEMLSAGKSAGVFQLESYGMQKLLKDVKPKNIMDLAIVLALYRPGPLGAGMHTEYAERRRGEPYKNIHPALASILKETYGIIIFQEQVIKITHELAGYTKAEADIFREAVGKKKPEQMAQERPRFIKGLIDKSGFTKEQAEELFGQIEYFAGYGFNTAHAVSYAIIAYHTAYLKCHYPGQFYTARINELIVKKSDKKAKERIAKYKKEARYQSKITILPVDINKSETFYTYEQSSVFDSQAIRVGLLALDGVGKLTCDRIIKRRGDKPYKDLKDFIYRNQTIYKNNLIHVLIDGGAFNSFGLHDELLREQLDQILIDFNYMKSMQEKKQMILF